MDNSSTHRYFEVKFLHLTGKAQVYKVGAVWMAFIVFHEAYMVPGANNYAIPNILASDVDEAAEMVLNHFKEIYACLDHRIREIGKHNFFVTRRVFKTAIVKKVGEFVGSFVYHNHYFAITENVDGQKYVKTKFGDRNSLNTLSALFVINWDAFVWPAKNLGFNLKFISGILIKHNQVKVHHLRIHNDPLLFDEVRDKVLNNPVSEHRDEFAVGMIMQKMMPPKGSI